MTAFACHNCIAEKDPVLRQEKEYVTEI